MTGASDQEKKEAINTFLEGDHVLLHINPAITGLALPDYLMKEQTVTLRISRHYQGSLDIGEGQITAELRFSGVYNTCTIPYGSLWGCTSDKGEFLLWPAAEHLKLFEQLSTNPALKPQAAKQPTAPQAQKRPLLKRIK